MNNSTPLAYIILSVAIIYAFGYPGYQKVSNLISQKNYLSDSLASINNIEQRKNDLLIQYNNISKREVDMVRALIPENLDYVKFAYDIDSAASRYGISIKNTSLSEKQPASFSEAQDVSALPYNSNEINVSFSASYENFSKFIADLEKSLRLLDVVSIRITNQEKSIYNFDVGFRTYWSKDLNVNQNEE